MYQIRRSNERGHADHGWLNSHHTFSFAEYYDPRHMGFGPLRVINEDRVAGGAGFPTHPHRDMEIISYVLDGGLEHKDSMGTGSVIRPGDVQRMSAGTGVLHSEYNASKQDPVHFLQIWIVPERAGIEPSYEQKAFDPAEKKNKFRLLASRNGEEGSVTVHQDAKLLGATLDAGVELEQPLDPNRKAWLHVARGSVVVEGETLEAGDAMALVEASKIRLEGKDKAELLLFDLA
ncbi:MAG: pirin family protein [Myxococcota bacterium]